MCRPSSLVTERVWQRVAVERMNFKRFYHTGWLRERNRASKGVHPRFGVGTVWRGIRASGGWRCLPSLGETQCGRQAWPYGGVRQLGRVRGQAQGRHVRGSDGAGVTWSGWTPSIRHLLRITTPGRLGMLLGGALRGRSPRTREGRLGPTAQNCSGQWSVVSGQ